LTQSILLLATEISRLPSLEKSMLLVLLILTLS